MDIALIVNYLRPTEEWTLDGETYEGLTWLDETEKPTLEEIKAAEKAALANYKKLQDAKIAARQSALAKLAELGLTADEIAAL
jgi:hypothetical protein